MDWLMSLRSSNTKTIPKPECLRGSRPLARPSDSIRTRHWHHFDQGASEILQSLGRLVQQLL